jgi:thiosulfate/3-mercaptopyruvate sulfurtransferase
VGISDESRVVVYLAEGRPVYLVTRALWTLEFMGLGERSALLDGGYAAWVAEGRPVETGATGVTAGTLSTAPDWSRIVSRDWVVEHLDAEGMALVDARTTPSYTGERDEIPGRGGHIPGAGSLPMEELLNEDGTLRSTGELRDLFARAGVEDGDTVVAYCHVGLRATAVIVAARAAGFNALLYDGSMTEWVRDTELPLVPGTSPR